MTPYDGVTSHPMAVDLNCKKLRGKKDMVTHVIFDFDGTIVDSGRLVFDLFNEFAEKYNYQRVLESEAELIRSIPIKDRFKKLKVPLLKVPLLTLDVVKKYEESLPKLKSVGGIKDVLIDLKRKGICLVVLSANSEQNIKQFLQSNDMDLFDSIIISNRFFGRHIAINQFLKKNASDKRNTIFVGDEHRDIVASKKSGIKIIAATWGYDSEKLIVDSQPDYIAKIPSDITRHIKGMNV
jgi:phosphoglycolate phosphatase